VVTDEVLPVSEAKLSRPSNTSWSRAVNTSSRVIDASWRGLRNRWLLIISCSLVLIVVLSSYYLRQLPGQLNDDPLAAARWLMTASTEYGLAGELWNALGLFNLARSPLLHFLLALIGLILFVHLGDLVGAAWRLRQVTTLLAMQAAAGAPLPISTLQPLYRWRQSALSQPDEAAQALRDRLTAHFDSVESVTVDESVDTARLADELPTGIQRETRLLARHQWRWAMVRPLAILGLLLFWFVIWLTLTVGWTVMPSALAPGAEYRYAAHELVLQYQVPEQANAPEPVLAVYVGADHKDLPATRQSRARIGPVEVETAPGPPGLLISTVSKTGTNEPLLGRSGQSNTVAAVGLVFPNPGSEESLVLARAAVLRIMRMADDNKNMNAGAFTIEVYQDDDKQPVQRLQISETKTESIPLNGQKITLRFTPLPSLNIEVHYLPGAWLLWIAFGLILIGAIAFWRQPAFLLAQIAAWPENRSVIIVQGDAQNEVEALRKWVSSETVSQ
jgi:hypothetical protein